MGGGLSDEEKNGLTDMLEVHDWPEALAGDEAILHSDEKQLDALKKNKAKKERVALEEICGKLGEQGKEIFALWERYEKRADPAASLASQIDKYQAVERALLYEIEQGVSLFREFDYYEWALGRITHPALLARLRKLDAYWRKNHLE